MNTFKLKDHLGTVIISMLVVFLFLVCMDLALNKKKALNLYREQQNYDGDSNDQEHQKFGY